MRRPAVAGRFYPSNPKRLTQEVNSYLDEGVESVHALGVVSPHAGYVYSGIVAGEVFSRVVVPKRVIILGPNHRGVGERAAIISRGGWKMPQGTVEIDSDLAKRLLIKSILVKEDEKAHDLEHSLEVQVPFLQTIREDVLITPLALGRLSLDECIELGQELASVIEAVGGDTHDILIVASSDMTHYEPHDVAKKKDMEAIDRILALDPRGLFDEVKESGITMCGVVPVTVMLEAAKKLGAKRAELVDYKTSGDTSGDYDSVVGYAGIVVM